MNAEEKLFAFLVGALIYKLRKEKGMTQKELASKVNLPQQYISKIEKNKVQIKYVTFIKILKIFGKEIQIVDYEQK